MTQNEINRAVTIATGDCLCEIQRLGFSIADPDEVCFDPEPDDREPLMVDWDEVEFNRNAPVSWQPAARQLSYT